MCRWMGSHFHKRVDYNGVTFLVELLEWGRTFSGFLVSRNLKIGRVVHDICPKVTKMGSIAGHIIGYNGVRVLKGQWYIPSKT